MRKWRERINLCLLGKPLEFRSGGGGLTLLLIPGFISDCSIGSCQWHCATWREIVKGYISRLRDPWQSERHLNEMTKWSDLQALSGHLQLQARIRFVCILFPEGNLHSPLQGYSGENNDTAPPLIETIIFIQSTYVKLSILPDPT